MSRQRISISACIVMPGNTSSIVAAYLCVCVCVFFFLFFTTGRKGGVSTALCYPASAVIFNDITLHSYFEWTNQLSPMLIVLFVRTRSISVIPSKWAVFWFALSSRYSLISECINARKRLNSALGGNLLERVLLLVAVSSESQGEISEEKITKGRQNVLLMYAIRPYCCEF